MKPLSKNYKLFISIMAVMLNMLTSALAYSFIGELGLSFEMRWLIGCLIMLSPMFTFWVVVALWRKEKANQTEKIDF